jgi:excisionase family DNA binding protein
LTPNQAAAALGISRSLLYRLLAAGEIESIKIGALRRIRPESLTAWIEAQRAAQAEPQAVSSANGLTRPAGRGGAS